MNLTSKSSELKVVSLVLIICILPFLLTLFGVSFSSPQITVSGTGLSIEQTYLVLSGAFHHALLEWSAVTVAVIAAVVCLFHFKIYKNLTIAIIGMALFSAALVDSFHTLAATRLIQASVENTEFIPFTWAASRTFHALIMIFATAWGIKVINAKGVGRESKIGSLPLLVPAVLFLVLAVAIIYWSLVSENIPQTMFADSLIRRPFDVLPLGLYIFSGVLFYHLYQLKPNKLVYALILSSVIECVVQLHMAFGSSELFDSHFNIAHGLKLFAYSTILFGVMFDLISNKTIAEKSLDSSGAPLLKQTKPSVTSVKFKLTTQIPVAFFSLALIVTVVESFAFYFESKTILKQQDLVKLKESTQLVEPMVKQLYQKVESDILFLANSQLVTQVSNQLNVSNENKLTKNNLMQLETLLLNKLSANDSYYKVRLIGIADSGRELATAVRDPNYRVVNRAQLQRKSQRSYFQKTLTLKAGEVYFSPLELNREFGEVITPWQRVIRATTGVFNEQQQMVAMVVLSIDFNHFFESLSNSFSESETLYIANSAGQLLVHPNKQLTFAFEFGRSSTLADYFPSLSELGSQNQITSILSLTNATDTFTGPAVLRKVQTVQGDELRAWQLLITDDVYQLNAQLTSFRDRNLVIGLGMALVALAVAMFLSRKIAGPLEAVTHVAQFYEQDKDLSRLPLNEQNEIGLLARRLDTLLSNLHDKERTLEELSWRLEFALSAPNIGVWDFNLKTQELLWDKRMYNLYHVDQAQNILPYQHFVNALHPGDRDAVLLAFEQSIATNQDLFAEFRIILADKQIRYIQSHGRVIRDNSDVIRMVGTSMDITEQRELESERELALVKAKESAQLKSEFLASMSHEIRTPMNGVIGMLGLLQQSELATNQRRYVELASSSANSLLSIINDILDFSKIEAGKLDIELINFNLKSMLGDIAESFGHKAQAKGIEIILDVTKVTDGNVEGDPSRIRQVLINLIGNAHKFTSQGEILITASTVKNEDASLSFVCSVKDTGIGISEQKLAHIFGSFIQVDASTTRQYGGTGLGLAIVKQLCQLMQGDINVTSELGVGSEFTFNIKLKEVAQKSVGIPEIDISGLNILVVDDNATNLEVISKQLDIWGANATTVTNGQQAIEYINQPDVAAQLAAVIIDMQMPFMDGAELGKKVREHKEFDHIKLIMMTSMAQQGDARMFANLGFNAYFPKPFTYSDLLSAIKVLASDDRDTLNNQGLITHHTINELSEPESVKKIPDKKKNTESIELPKETKVLVVEDNLVNQTLTKALLTKLGLSLDIANNGKEAINLIKENSYNLVLMDCQMPVMDGYESTRLIRQGEAGSSNANITIIALTANAMQGDKEKCIDAGMNDYISKPINNQELAATLTKWLLEIG